MEHNGGCLDLNIIHGSPDSRKEYIRNTMIYQEELFKKQVIELHHIYWVQKDLMKNIGIKGKAETTQYRPCGAEQSRADVKTGLSIGWDGWQNGGGRNDYREKCVELGLMGDALNASLASLDFPACSRDNQDSPDCVLSMYSIGNSSIMHVPYGGTTSSLDEILSSGPRHHQDGQQLNDDKKNTASSFCEGQQLDLNKYPCGETCSQCNDLAMADSSSNVSKQGANISQTSRVQQDAYSTYTESEGKSNPQSDRIGIVCHTGIGPVSEMVPGMHRNSDSHPVNHDFLNTQAPSNEACGDGRIQGCSILIVKDDVEISNVSVQGNTDEDINSNKCVSSKKDYSVEEFSATVGNGHALSKVSPGRMSHDNDSSACTNSSLGKESEPSFVNDAKPQPFHETDKEPPEFVSSEQRDVVQLNGFSKDQDAVEETNRTEKLKKELPQYSSDSFESIVLKLPESNVDGHCVTSKLYEVDDTSTRDSGLKLRRGSRRIKDFRKDVLPHLPSLSSKEIHEDLKIMQDALRSKEYKRLRSKEQNEPSGSSPLKSRKTRCNRVTRRRNT